MHTTVFTISDRFFKSLFISLLFFASIGFFWQPTKKAGGSVLYSLN